MVFIQASLSCTINNGSIETISILDGGENFYRAVLLLEYFFHRIVIQDSYSTFESKGKIKLGFLSFLNHTIIQSSFMSVLKYEDILMKQIVGIL